MIFVEAANTNPNLDRSDIAIFITSILLVFWDVIDLFPSLKHNQDKSVRIFKKILWVLSIVIGLFLVFLASYLFNIFCLEHINGIYCLKINDSGYLAPLNIIIETRVIGSFYFVVCGIFVILKTAKVFIIDK